MASITNTFSFCFFSLILFSISLQPHARNTKFVTNSPSTPTPAPASVLLPGLVPVTDPVLAPSPAPIQEEHGYGLFGQGSTELSSNEYHTSPQADLKNALPAEVAEKETPATDEFSPEKLLSGGSYSTDNNENIYWSSMNENNGYKNNENGYSQNMYNDNYNGFSRSPENDENNGYMNEDSNNYVSKNTGYDGNGYEMGLSDTRFMENGNYKQEESSDGEGYYRNNEKSKYEFDTMEEYERQQGYLETEYMRP